MNRALVVLFIVFSSAHASGTYTLSGTVRDGATGDPLAAATIRILGTSHGTITNVLGQYTLTLEAGSYALAFSSLGYRPDTVRVELTSNQRRDIRLTPTDITLPEIVVTAEDPAIEIIRRAIAAKHRWIDRLLSYSFDAFTRQVLFRDTSIASITESFSRGSWRQGDTLRETITQRRQTANVGAGFNFASVGRILNFNDDEIRFAGYTFVGPTALDALDYYDYKLLRTRTLHGNELYEIRMIPRTRTVPLFEGTLMIDGTSYALAGVDVLPNEAFLIPFVKEKSLRYRQQFTLFDNDFWLPTDIRIDASVVVGIVGFSIPRIGFSQTSVITDYSINTPIPDSIFQKPHLTIDSAASRPDSALWTSTVVLPLSDQERDAYRTLDSTKTLDVQFRPGGVAMTIGLGDESSAAASVLSFLDAGFNRVEGLHLGVAKDFDSLTTQTLISAGAAYGFGDRRWKYHVGATLYATAAKTAGIGFEGYHALANVPDRGYFGTFVVGLGCLLGKQDYRDYYRADGWRVFLALRPVHNVRAKLIFENEIETSETKRTDFSLMYPSRLYRENPAITDGMMRDIRFEARIGPDPFPLDLVTQNALDLTVEHSDPSLAKSNFKYTRYTAVASLAFPTFSRSYLFPQMVRLRLTAGGSTGDLPPQRLYSVESALSGYSPFGTMHTLSPRELTGDRMVSAVLEHNFRTIPFLALGIPFLYENNIELIAHGGTARVWGTSNSSADLWHVEAGFGINRIFEILRADFSWRLSGAKGFVFTLGVAQVL